MNYRLVAHHSGKLADIFDVSTTAGAVLQQWSVTGGLNQQFDFLDSGGGFYRIRAWLCGLVLRVASNSTGADITQQPDGNAASQQWRVVDQGGDVVSLVNRQSGLSWCRKRLTAVRGLGVSWWSRHSSVLVDFVPLTLRSCGRMLHWG
jgi:hypothetical protein